MASRSFEEITQVSLDLDNDLWKMKYFVFINNPAIQLIVPPLVTFPFFDDAVDGQMLQAGILGEKLAMTALPNARSPGDDDIGFGSCHGFKIHSRL